MNNFISKFTGSEIDNILEGVEPLKNFDSPIHLEDGTSLNNCFEPGFYYSWSSANTDALVDKPEGIVGGFVLIVIRYGWQKNSVIQIIFPNSDGVMFTRKKVSTVLGPWFKSYFARENYKTSGTTSQRVIPAEGGSRSVVGEQYFDITLGKPIWWTGDTSDGKSGWVDATGANMPNASV